MRERFALLSRLRWAYYVTTEAANDKIVAAIVFDSIGFRNDAPNSQDSLPGFPAPSQGNFIAVIGNAASAHGKLWLAQVDCSYLGLIGEAGELRFGGGIQRPGLWTPAALGTISILFGERLSFRMPEHPWPSSGPVITAGISLAPLRFMKGNRTVSVLELGIGVKPDLPGVGVTYSLGILEIAHKF